MVNIIKQEIEVEEALKKKLEFICSFCNTKFEIKKGSIRTIEKTNLSYVEPHRIIIKGITFLAFNYETSIYIENLSKSILIRGFLLRLPCTKADLPFSGVKELYLSEFEEARLEYNSKQSRLSRMIDNYFDNVSNNEKKDLACEIILELGDKEYWDTKDENFKKKMSEVYKKQVDDLEMLVPNFKVASAIIHYDETSPHLHIVGVPIKYKNKNGMEKQVGKSDVFTKESLIRLQDKMRTLCIEEFNQVYSLDSTLKQKQKGRNRDIHVSDMDNYIEMKKQIEKNTENLKQANKKSSELKQNSKDIKDKIDKLKISKLNKDNYILSKEDKDSFIDFINQVDNTGKEYDKIQTLSNTLVNAHEQLKDKNNKIKTLTENNEALNLRVKTLNDTIKEKDNKYHF